jgi:hypothetical protein
VRSRRLASFVAMTVALLSGVLISPTGLPAAGLALTTLFVAPSSGLVDGQAVQVRVSGGTLGTTYVVADCDPKALLLLLEPGASPQDDCDSRHVGLMTVGATGQAELTMDVPALLTTALGGADCRKVACFLAVYALHYLGGARLLVHSLGFAASACAKPTSCIVPADAWDPSLGPPPLARTAPPATTAPLTTKAPEAGLLSAGKSLSLTEQPVRAGDLSLAGSVSGPYTGSPLEPALTATAATAPAEGVGLLRLAMASPGTSWGPGQPSSTVVDATVEDISTGTSLGVQQFVLFWGAKPFVYAGFTGLVSSANRYRLTLRVEPPASLGGLSQPLPGQVPRVRVLGSALEVVTPSNPAYLVYSYAPVMYGRSTSALHDVPLLIYADEPSAGGGATRLSYVVVWSHEDAGTGFVPFVEWGRWGRMTDIEGAISLTVGPQGKVLKAEYLWGGEPLTGFPDSQSALREVDTGFSGEWWGNHPVIRDATGNNDFSDKGATRFRFLLAPVAAPPAGELRDAVMDANPWTYSVMNDEVSRWYADVSTDPASPAPGTAEQYAIVDMSTRGRGVSSVAVDLRLGGKWYRSDLGWGFPLVGTGHVRTVVKLPVGWAAQKLTAAQVAVEPPSASRTVSVQFLRVEFWDGSSVVQVPAPAPTVVPETLDVQAS